MRESKIHLSKNEMMIQEKRLFDNDSTQQTIENKQIIMKIRVASIFLSFFILSSITAQNNFSIKGHISPKYNNSVIELVTWKNDSILKKQTCTVKNGTFHFQGQEYLDEISGLNFPYKDKETRNCHIILEKGNILVHIDDSIAKIGGTPLSDLNQNFTDSIIILSDRLRKYLTIRKEEEGQYNFMEEALAYQSYLGRFVKKNITNQVGQVILLEYLRSFTYADFNDILFTSPTTLQANHKVLKEFGLEVVGISFYQSVKPWKEVLVRLETPWENLVALDQQKQSRLKNEYKIAGIPFGILIDKNGTILATGLLSRKEVLQKIEKQELTMQASK